MKFHENPARGEGGGLPSEDEGLAKGRFVLVVAEALAAHSKVVAWVRPRKGGGRHEGFCEAAPVGLSHCV